MDVDSAANRNAKRPRNDKDDEESAKAEQQTNGAADAADQKASSSVAAPAPAAAPGAAPAVSAPVSLSAGIFMKEKLVEYYKHLYPFDEMFQWLGYGKPDYFRHREFSFTILNQKNEEIYIRYKCFAKPEEFRSSTVAYAPVKIDIGAFYNKLPSQHANSVLPLVPMERELVFDIDMDDYQPVKGCGCTARGQVCRSCWHFMTVATKVMHRILTENFGFQNILWVFSGRRGMHCWIADPRARKLTVEGRAAVASFLSVLEITAQNKSGKTKALHPLHEALLDAFNDVLMPTFEQHIMLEHKLFDTAEKWTAVLELLPSPQFDKPKEVLQTRWQKDADNTTPERKWEQLKATVQRHIDDEAKTSRSRTVLPNPVIDIVFTYTWPRLDVAVSKGMNHLLKAPFCIHPATGRVCVPVDPHTCETFDVTTVPTLDQLLTERSKPGVDLPFVHSLMRVDYFRERFLLPLLHRETADQRAANPSLDW